MVHPDFSKPFILQVDASNFGIGAVLAQCDGKGKDHPIAYWSRKLTIAETKMSATERECLGAVEAIKHFRAYLYGQFFIIETDHKSLEHMDSFKQHNGRVARWKMTLSDYNFAVRAKPGLKNGNADTLSRIPSDLLINSSLPIINITMSSPEYLVNTVLDYKSLDNLKNHRYFREHQLADLELRKYIELLETGKTLDRHNLKLSKRISKLYMQNGLLYYLRSDVGKPITHAKLCLAIPSEFRTRIIDSLHKDPTAAHQGIDRTYDLINNRFWWPKMYADVREYVMSCVKCLARKTPRVYKAGLLQPITVTKAWDLVGMDILGPLPMSKRGYRYILVICDYLTRFPICISLKDIKAETVARAFVDNVILQFGAPKRVLTDRGSNFRSEFMKQVMSYFSTTQSFTTAYHPQTDGLVERFNHTLAVMLSMYVHDNQREWDVYLKFVQHGYRTARHPTTGYSPYRALFGFEPNTMIECLFPELTADQHNSNNDVLDELQIAREIVRKYIGNNMLIAQQKASEYYNQYRRDISFKIGDRVWFYWPARGKQNHISKLSLPWSGPYTIIARRSELTYLLARPDGSLLNQYVHVDRLKPCTSSITPDEFITLHENDNFNPDLQITDNDIIIDNFPIDDSIIINEENIKENNNNNQITVPNVTISTNNSENDTPYVEPEWRSPLAGMKIFEAIKRLYLAHRDNPLAPLAPIRKELKQTLSGEFINSNRRISSFHANIKDIKSHAALLEFLRSTLSNFNTLFAPEIERDLRRGPEKRRNKRQKTK